MSRRGVAAALSATLASLFATSPAVADHTTKAQCVAANESAQSLRKAGKLRDARSQLLVCMAEGCPGAVRADCTQMLQDVDRAQPDVVFDIKDASGQEVKNARMTLDGQVLQGALGAAAIALDPGPHRVAFEADGFMSSDQTFSLQEGEKERRVTIVMQPVGKPEAAPEPAPGPAGPPPISPPATAATQVSGEAPASSEPESNMKRIAAYAALGVGGAGIALGSIFGILALSKGSSLHTECPDHACTPAAQGDISSLHTNTMVANVGFGVGVVGLAAGGVLFFLSRPGANAPTASATSSPSVTPWVGLRALGVEGYF